MILTEARYIYDATQFAAGLQSASQGVVRLQLGTIDHVQFVATGWLITDWLVVVPAFALATGWTAKVETVYVVPAGGGEPIAASIEKEADRADEGTPDPLHPALLRLSRALPKRALQLAIATPRPAEPVFLLHHPLGVAELMLSWGRLVGLQEQTIRYDADTEPGSSGGPVFSADWRVLGMHIQSSASDDPDGRFNAGVTISGLVERLSAFDAWSEIAAYHGLADVTGARRGMADAKSAPRIPDAAVDGDLLAAAVLWTVDPSSLREDLRETMAALVIDRSHKRWILRGDERAKLIAAASLDELRAARGSAAVSDRGQRVIDRILAGPPFDLEAIEESDLPVWLQAVRWFAGVVPDLPTPGTIHRDLARRRSRSRLTDIAGPGFRGRTTELGQLTEWLGEPAGVLMAITGIGGVGKSALVAKLALELPPETVLLWLDFDRADLAPDDPVSVLSILFDQLSLAVEDLQLPAVDESSWRSAIEAMGSLVAPALGGRQVLLVLDGFEVAQHAPRHEEIWRVIEQVLTQLPRTNVIVSGRAPIGNVTLAGRTVRSIHLVGLDRTDAEAWLRDAGVKRRDVLDPVLEMSRGVPLILRLAVGWLQSGGKVTDLPDQLPAQLVEGFLYQRILDRVVDVELKPVARDILVLRYLTPEMLEPIVADSLPAGVPPEEVFRRLTHEMALVGDSSEAALGPALPVTISVGPDRLILRPELRAATVHLLETADARRVKTIDRRAARWYATQDLDDPAIRAEHVYHLLRAGSVKAAAAAWRAECLPFLAGAEEELPERATRARAWLRRQSREAAHDPVAVLSAWEADAVGRVRAMLIRGFESGVSDVLGEHTERIPDGPLVVYDSWVAWRAGDVERARAILGQAPPTVGPIGRDRAVLAARLALAAGDVFAADDLLASIEEDARWQDRPQAILDATTVTAARIRLATDLDAELRLSRLLLGRDKGTSVVSRHLPIPTTDIVLPLLARRLSTSSGFESLGESIPIPMSPGDHDVFVSRIDERRLAAAEGRPLLMLASPPPPTPGAEGFALLEQGLLAQAPPDPLDKDEWALAARLETLALKRWWFAARGPFLSRACDALLTANRALDPQPLSIGGVLGAFIGNEWAPFRLFHPNGGPLEKIVHSSPLEQLSLLEPPPTPDQLVHAVTFLDAAAEEWSIPNRPDITHLLAVAPPDASATVSEPGAQAARATATTQVLTAFAGAGPALDGVGVYLLSPDPLDVLLRRVLGVPDQLGR